MSVIIRPSTKAFIIYDGKILLLRESSEYAGGTNEGKWDVAGGKVKTGQRFDESLLREIKEETGLEAKLGDPFHVDEWRPNIRGKQWQIVGTFFECFAESDKVLLSKDHDKYVWIDPKDYLKYDLIETLKSAFKKYLNRTQ